MKKGKLLWISILILLSLLYIGISYYFALQVVAFPTRTLEEDRIKYEISSTEDFGISNPKEIHFPSGKVEISGWYVPGEEHCGIIFHHGHKGTRYGMLKYVPMFQKMDCNLLLIDARHHGNSSGEYGTFGFYEKKDLLQAVDWMEKKDNLSDSEIGLVGESYGASTTLLAGESGRSFWFLLADSPYKDMKTIIIEQGVQLYSQAALIFVPLAFEFSSWMASYDPDEVSPEKYADKIHSPLFLTHSGSDDYTLPYHSEDIFKKVRYEPKELFITDWGSKHAKSIDDDFETYSNEFLHFLKRNGIMHPVSP